MKNLSRILFWLFLCSVGYAPVVNAQLSAQQTGVGTAGGSANAITLSVPNVNSLSDLTWVPIRFTVAITNTSATTVTVNSTAATPLKKITSTGLSALVGNELVAANPAEIFYDGTEYVISTPYPQIAATSNTVQGFGTSASAGANTYTPSVGVLRVYAQCWGAGGPGFTVGSGSNHAGDGGGGGEYRFGVFAITPGAAITVTNGAGGSPGNNGADTTFGSYITAKGGSKATNYGGSGHGAGGTGGTGGVGIPGYAGGNGFTTGGNDNLSGNGGATFGTSIANGVVPAASAPGNFPGGGGGGGNGGSGAGTGGTGANGFCIVQELAN